MNEFERGAMYAMQLLAKQLQEREEKIRQLQQQAGNDEGTVLNGLYNVYGGIRSAFETGLMKTIREAQKSFKP